MTAPMTHPLTPRERVVHSAASGSIPVEGGETLPKLTKPQRDLLDELPTTCAESYPPARKLVALGLAEWERGSFGDRLVRKIKDTTHDR